MKPTFTPYAQVSGDLPSTPAEIDELLADAWTALNMLEGISDCHTAAKTFHEWTGKGTVVRGWYVPSKLWEHSWLDFGSYILDIYPVGGARPIIVAKEVGRHLYITEFPRPTRILDMDGDPSQG